MRLNDPEEILPLLDHAVQNNNNNNSANDGLPIYHYNKRKTYTLLNEAFDDDANITEQSGQSFVNYDPFIRTSSFGTKERVHRSQSRGNHSRNQIAYSWNNLCVSVRIQKKIPVWKKLGNLRKNLCQEEQKHILKNVYGLAQPGELLAIMGPSGAGKTTLLNALTFQSSSAITVKGSRYLNEYFINNREVITKFSAYVEQESLFMGTLTVKEHLTFQALVRMDRSLSTRQKLRRVEEVIAELELEKCQNTIIGYPGRTKGISGGEMRRLSFASEVLTNPPLMFCDEPTSGLDSFIALNVINILKSMAFRGKTVICTIHQPSSEIFSLFDKILLLAEGKTAFLGKPNDAVSFFSEFGASPLANYNPADYYVQLLAVTPGNEENCRETITFISSSFDQSSYGLEVSSNIERRVHSQTTQSGATWSSLSHCSDDFIYPATWLLQFRALFWRSFLNIIKEPILVKVRLFQTVVLSLVVGLIYHNQKLNEDGVMNINGVLFTFLTNMTFQNLFAVISVFSSELPIFLKEHANKRYRTDAYFLSKTLAEIPMFLVIPILFTSITYFWINLNPTFEHFAFTVLILILVTNAATSFGYFISCVSTNVVMALSIGPPFIIPFLLFGGFLLNLGTTPAYFQWLSYLSWFKYGNEALQINQWADIENIECSRLNATCPKNGKIILEIYNFKEDQFWWDLGCLLLLILFFRLLAFMALVLKTWRYKTL